MNMLIKNLFVWISGNGRFQRLLEKNVEFSQHLMGIGAGSKVASSGETILIQELRQQWHRTGQPLCVFDVGANQGQFLSLVRIGLQEIPVDFHVFEPGKTAFQILEEKNRSFSNTHLNNLGLGNQIEQVALYSNAPGSSLASLSKRRLTHLGIEFGLAETIQLITLDEYCVQHPIDEIDLLKLDVEGHELAVLRGAQETFRAGKVRMLTFEFGGSNIDSRTYFQDFWYLLHEYGMRHIFRITPSGYLAKVVEYRELYEQFRTTNYFVSREAL